MAITLPADGLARNFLGEVTQGVLFSIRIPMVSEAKFHSLQDKCVSTGLALYVSRIS